MSGRGWGEVSGPLDVLRQAVKFARIYGVPPLPDGDSEAALAAVERLASDNERLREERDALREAIRTAIQHWPGEAHLGTAYYALIDALPAEGGAK